MYCPEYNVKVTLHKVEDVLHQWSVNSLLLCTPLTGQHFWADIVANIIYGTGLLRSGGCHIDLYTVNLPCTLCSFFLQSYAQLHFESLTIQPPTLMHNK